jgi:hypothetical protein
MTKKVKQSMKAQTKIDEKQKNKLVEQLLKDYPEYRDSLKQYLVETMVESYLQDPTEFVKKANDYEKREKKGGKVEPKPVLEELICITKEVAPERQAEPSNLAVNDAGLIV